VHDGLVQRVKNGRSKTRETEERTNISSAVRDGRLSKDMASEADRMSEKLDRPAIAGSRNGLRESGRGGGSSKGEAGLCGPTGDTARLRKGLFEERLSKSPEDRWSKWHEAKQVSDQPTKEQQLGPAAPCMRMTTVKGT
jgi:hypothetical protein